MFTDVHKTQIIAGLLGIGGTIFGAVTGAAISGFSGWRTERKRQLRQLEAIKIAVIEEPPGSEMLKAMVRAQEFFRDNNDLLAMEENRQFYERWLRHLDKDPNFAAALFAISNDVNLAKIQAASLSVKVPLRWLPW